MRNERDVKMLAAQAAGKGKHSRDTGIAAPFVVRDNGMNSRVVFKNGGSRGNGNNGNINARVCFMQSLQDRKCENKVTDERRMKDQDFARYHSQASCAMVSRD